MPLFDALCAARERNDEAMNKTIAILINVGGTQLITPNRYRDFPDHCTRYVKYTPLHLVCELGLKEHGFHLIKKMSEEGFSFDTLALYKSRGSRQESFSRYNYTSLHLAIVRGHEDIALKLIEAGASINIKATIKRPTTYFCGFFSDVEHIEKSPLQLAIEQKQTKVIRAIQLILLDEYIVQRQKEEEYLSHATILGYTFRFGYFNKTQKLEEALAFKKLLMRGEFSLSELKKINQGALEQGRLGQIAQLSYYLNADKPDSNKFNFAA